MNRNTRLLSVLAAIGLAAASSAASAQATRTWISGVGDDANPCSRTAPCRTWQGAIGKTAEGGTMQALDPGGFGAVTITKSITLDNGNGGMGGILVAGQNGIIVNAGPEDVVTIRNVVIEGLGGSSTTYGINGILFQAGGALNLQNVEIRGFGNRAISMVPTTGNSSLHITGSTLHENGWNSAVTPVDGTGGVFIGPTGTALVTATITDSKIYNNYGFGVRAISGANVSLTDCAITGNRVYGVVVASTSLAASATIDNCRITGNGGAPEAGGAGVLGTGAQTDVQLARSTITHNEYGVRALLGASVRSLGDNLVTRNGIDTDGFPTATVPSL